MRELLNPGATSMGFVAAYVAAVWLEMPLFVYDPVGGGVYFGGAEVSGPTMSWYGSVTTALVAGLLAGAVIPEPRSSRAWKILLLVVPVAAVLLLLAHEVRWWIPG